MSSTGIGGDRSATSKVATGPRWCVSDPLARFARVSPSQGGEPPKAAGGRLHTISNWSWATHPDSRGHSLPPLRGSTRTRLSPRHHIHTFITTTAIWPSLMHEEGKPLRIAD